MSATDYWRERALILEEAAHRQGEALARAAEREFRTASRRLRDEIEVWYARVARNNGVSLAEARRLLNAGELEEFRWSVEEYIRRGEESGLDGWWMRQLENASARVHVSRLEALQLQLQQEIELLYGGQLDGLDGVLRGVYSEGYYHTAFEIQRGVHLGWDLQSLDKRRLDAVLSRPWTTDGRTFRDRCWANKEALVRQVQTSLTQGFIRGDGADRMTKEIARQMEVSSGKTARLVMTETAYFSAQAQQDCYRELGVEQFEVVETLDGHTCEVCQGLDGKVLPMSAYEPGVTAPPFHPWCRGCTAPWFPDNFGERAARDREGETYYVPERMKYPEWKRNFIDGDKKSGIIKTGGDSMDVKIDPFTPCLMDTKTGSLVDTEFAAVSKEERSQIAGWGFDWNDEALGQDELYKLTLAGSSEIQGLVAIRRMDRDKAVYIHIAESAPHNLGPEKLYSGVGGHLFAIAAQKSVEAGYGGYFFMDAKNLDLVRHYQKTLGAMWLGMPHEYRMVVDEEAAARLLDIYTLAEGTL